MARSSDIRLGQLLVQKKLCTLRQVNEALLRQKALRQADEKIPLGQLLVEGGALGEDPLRMVLAEMGVLRLHCGACRVDYPLTSYEPSVVQLCPQCNEKLAILDGPPVYDQPPKSGGDEEPPEAALSAPIRIPVRAPGSPGNHRKPEESCQKDAYIGKVLGGCQLLEKIGHGGMGVVYKAKQLNLGRTVAVKVLSQDLSSDETFVRRFVQEARSAAQLSHGNIVHINDVGECQGVFYFVMEYVDGQNLKEILNVEKQIDIQRALEITIQVCHALRHAHSRGVIHRDIKPENIMVAHDGVVKLADLGLAKRVATDNTSNLTHAGAILGTPYYMAPEQAKDFSKVDRRSDIYSLGVTLYRMVAGKVPFDGRSPIEVMIKAIDGKKISVRELREDVPSELEKIVDRMMHKCPEKRYQDIDEVLRDLVPAMNALVATQSA